MGQMTDEIAQFFILTEMQTYDQEANWVETRK